MSVIEKSLTENPVYVIRDGRKIRTSETYAKKIQAAGGKTKTARGSTGKHSAVVSKWGRSQVAGRGYSVRVSPTTKVVFTVSAERTPTTGAELVNYWKQIGVVGMRSDIPNAQEEARRLRNQAEAERKR